MRLVIDVELQEPRLFPYTVIIHAGSNDLGNHRNADPAEVAENIIAIGRKCKDCGVKKIMISSITPRQYVERRRRATNNHLKDLCIEYGFTYIDNSNIKFSDLCEDKIHLGAEGLRMIEDNYLYYLNERDILDHSDDKYRVVDAVSDTDSQ